VQEFYAWLSQQDVEDPNHYWPAALDIGRNLSLNPASSVFDLDKEIPWLWWGMRFSDQDNRNLIGQISPFEQEDPSLAIHAEPILRKRQRKQANQEAGKALVGILADIASFSVVGNALDLMELWAQRTQAKQNENTSAEQLLAKRTEELIAKTVTTLQLFLDADINDAPTTPVILILDDAQWIDPITVKALSVLFLQAREKHWPLMVIATHWQKEWNEYGLNNNEAGFVNLREAVDYIDGIDQRSCHEIVLEKLNIDDLEQVVNAALPNIDNEDKNKLLAEADGNPRALEEMMRNLLGKPERYFTGGDITNGLSRQGKKKLSDLQGTDMYQKIWDRFDAIELSTQNILTCGAMFGDQFLHPLVYDVLSASELDDLELTQEGLTESLSDAEKIHALMQWVSRHGHEFQQKIYHTVAGDYLKKEDTELLESRNAVLTNIIEHRLKPENIKELDQVERERFYTFALQYYFDQARNKTHQHALYGQALVTLLKGYSSSGAESLIVEWWQYILQHLSELEIVC